VIRTTTTQLIAEQLIAKFKQQKKAFFEAKAGPGKKSLAFLFLFEDINALKMQLKPEKIASSKKRKTESLIFSLLILMNHIATNQ
jgi:hypothetical protein